MHTHTHETRAFLFLLLSFLRTKWEESAQLPGWENEVMDHNSCGFQKHKSRSLLEVLSFPGEPLRAVATICIKYLDFTTSLAVLPSDISIRRSREFILCRTAVRWMRTGWGRPGHSSQAAGSHPAPLSQSCKLKAPYVTHIWTYSVQSCVLPTILHRCLQGHVWRFHP